MVHIGLQISATLENVDSLLTCHPNYYFFLKVSCSNCGETGEKWHGIAECERTFQNTRNPDGHNFYMKCKMCRHENTIDIVDKTNEIYSSNDSPNFKTIVQFDCRGVEPVDFSPRNGWIVHSTNNGQTFENIDLSEDDWVEYDAKSKCSVGIFDFKSKLVKLKK